MTHYLMPILLKAMFSSAIISQKVTTELDLSKVLKNCSLCLSGLESINCDHVTLENAISPIES